MRAGLALAGVLLILIGLALAAPAINGDSDQTTELADYQSDVNAICARRAKTFNASGPPGAVDPKNPDPAVVAESDRRFSEEFSGLAAELEQLDHPDSVDTKHDSFIVSLRQFSTTLGQLSIALSTQDDELYNTYQPVVADQANSLASLIDDLGVGECRIHP